MSALIPASGSMEPPRRQPSLDVALFPDSPFVRAWHSPTDMIASAAGVVLTVALTCSGQRIPGLCRLLLLAHLCQARDLVPDVMPITEHDRFRIALDIAAMTRVAGVRDGDVARAR